MSQVNQFEYLGNNYKLDITLCDFTYHIQVSSLDGEQLSDEAESKAIKFADIYEDTRERNFHVNSDDVWREFLLMQ